MSWIYTGDSYEDLERSNDAPETPPRGIQRESNKITENVIIRPRLDAFKKISKKVRVN